MKLRIALALAATASFVMPALAADYDPPIYVDEAPEYTPVEVGSGWYLRGDVGYNFNHPYKDFEQPDSYHEKDNQLFGSVGMGYHFNDWLRADLNFGILSGNSFSQDIVSSCEGTQTTTTTTTSIVIIDGVPTPVTTTNTDVDRSSRTCPGSDNGRNQAFTGMANGYVDLGTFSGLTPYVGAGVGLAYTTYRSALNDRVCHASQVTTGGGSSSTTVSFICDGQTSVDDDPVEYPGTVDSKKRLGLAWSLNAGFAYQISKNTNLDFGYQYVSLPGAEYVVNDGGIQTIDKDLNYHQFKIGLRYDLW